MKIKKLTKTGFGHMEIIIVIMVVIAIVGAGFFVHNSRSKQNDARAESTRQEAGPSGSYKTVYCTYTECYLNPGSGKAARTRWVWVTRECAPTHIQWRMGRNDWSVSRCLKW